MFREGHELGEVPVEDQAEAAVLAKRAHFLLQSLRGVRIALPDFRDRRVEHSRVGGTPS
ncbi:hypothetical protein GCM10011401_06040 [Nesterenkonia cremea]|uniref:Uncharacterized protein n=1 Tax=Nesterenkonia cremea TaxID=1882340 RepID=A0A917ANG4_9MICC|nr:hypothetical protein GCM10011401_06040 [Nesterenkonia cremea]